MGAFVHRGDEAVELRWQRPLLRRVLLLLAAVVLLVLVGLGLVSNTFVELYLMETMVVLVLFIGAVWGLLWSSVQQVVVTPMQQQLREQQAEIDRAHQARDEFMATMSHELRTPLTVLLGSSDQLAKSDLTVVQQETLQTIDISGRSLLYMLNDILDLSRLDTEGFSLEWSPFNMRELVEELQKIFPRRSTDDGITFKAELKGVFDHLLIGDLQRVRQIMLNLCGNAVKFTDQGEVHLQVEQLEEGPLGQGSWIRIVVEDQGIGMSTEVIEQLFEPFYQADSAISRRHGGTGLGLHISWKLIQLMGGMVEVQSEEGRGSRFQVDLPLQQGEPIAEAGQEDELLYFQGRILVAEDTREVQLLMRQLLEGYGIEVVIAEDGQQALERGLSESWDLILMDMQMPVMDGIEATTLLRQSFCQVPIVALTANVMQVHRNKFMQAGADAFLSKPVDESTLEKVLQQYLQSLSAEEAKSLQLAPHSHELVVSDELREIFLQGTAERQHEIRSALQERAWEALRLAAHNIKGSAANFGYPRLTDLARTVCDAVDQLSSDEEIEAAARALDEAIIEALPE